MVFQCPPGLFQGFRSVGFVFSLLFCPQQFLLIKTSLPYRKKYTLVNPLTSFLRSMCVAYHRYTLAGSANEPKEYLFGFPMQLDQREEMGLIKKLTGNGEY